MSVAKADYASVFLKMGNRARGMYVPRFIRDTLLLSRLAFTVIPISYYRVLLSTRVLILQYRTDTSAQIHTCTYSCTLPGIIQAGGKCCVHEYGKTIVQPADVGERYNSHTHILSR